MKPGPDFHSKMSLLQGHDWLNQSKVKLPLKEETSIATENFQFIPPVDVCVTGSYTTGTCIRQNMCIDVILKIPKVSPNLFIKYQLFL